MGYPVLKPQESLSTNVDTLTIEQKMLLSDIYSVHDSYEQFRIDCIVTHNVFGSSANCESLASYAYNSIKSICDEVISGMVTYKFEDEGSLNGFVFERFSHCDPVALEYVIKNVIKYSDGSGFNVFEKFRLYF